MDTVGREVTVCCMRGVDADVTDVVFENGDVSAYRHAGLGHYDSHAIHMEIDIVHKLVRLVRTEVNKLGITVT